MVTEAGRWVYGGRMATGSFPSADRAAEREAMVREQLISRGIRDPAVLRAMRDVPRHEFVPDDLRRHAYDDGPLAIGDGQTISQPFVVAKMIEALELDSTDRVLEVGTGSGYAAAILARIVQDVFTVERHAALRRSAADRLARLGFDGVRVGRGRDPPGLAGRGAIRRHPRVGRRTAGPAIPARAARGGRPAGHPGR